MADFNVVHEMENSDGTGRDEILKLTNDVGSKKAFERIAFGRARRPNGASWLPNAQSGRIAQHR